MHVNAFDTIGFIVFGALPSVLLVLVSIHLDQIGGNNYFYASLFVLSFAGVFFYVGMYEAFVSTPVMLTETLVYGFAIIYFGAMKSYAQKKGLSR